MVPIFSYFWTFNKVYFFPMEESIQPWGPPRTHIDRPLGCLSITLSGPEGLLTQAAAAETQPVDETA